MKKIFWSHNCPNKCDDNTLYLTKYDINHLERIFNKYNLIPESFDEVRIDFLFDRNYLIRYIIKELDILLKPKGKFIINATYTTVHENFIRSKSLIKHEFSISTNGRYILSNSEIDKRKISLSYRKEEKTLIKEDSIDKWSFGIITNGKKNEQVQDLISSIIKQNIPNYEVIICGPFTYPKEGEYPIIKVDDVVLQDDIRAPITKKKNKIVEKANYHNLMIMHDRYKLPDDWYKKMVEYGNYFDILSVPNISLWGGRVNDWVEYLTKPSQLYKTVFHLLPYSRYSNSWYSQGGLLIVKKYLYKNNNLDERLHWDELEDIQFSQIGNLMGWFLYFDNSNKIYTFSDRIKEVNTKHYLFRHVFKPYLKYMQIKAINVTKYLLNRINIVLF